MGLMFPLEIDIRKSQRPEVLVIRTHKKQMSLGGVLIFMFLLLSTMLIASDRIFEVLWSEGNWFDQSFVALLLLLLGLAPIGAIVAWFLKDQITIRKTPAGTYQVDSDRRLLGIKWNQHHFDDVGLSEFSAANQHTTQNLAAIQESKRGIRNPYAVRGHWQLRLRDHVLEQRAGAEDIEDLLNQIFVFFDGAKPTAAAPGPESSAMHSNAPTSPSPSAGAGPNRYP